MTKFYKKNLCYVLTIIILFSGMCFENNQTDSLFGCKQTSHTKTYNYLLCMDNYVNGPICILKTLDTKTLINSLNTFKSISPKIVIKNSLAYSCYTINLYKFPCITKNTCITKYSLPQINVVIFKYIHDKDGKK